MCEKGKFRAVCQLKRQHWKSWKGRFCCIIFQRGALEKQMIGLFGHRLNVSNQLEEFVSRLWTKKKEHLSSCNRCHIGRGELAVRKLIIQMNTDKLKGDAHMGTLCLARQHKYA